MQPYTGTVGRCELMPDTAWGSMAAPLDVRIRPPRQLHVAGHLGGSDGLNWANITSVPVYLHVYLGGPSLDPVRLAVVPVNAARSIDATFDLPDRPQWSGRCVALEITTETESIGLAYARFDYP